MRIYPFIILFFFIINCSSNKVTNYHGIKSLESKFNKIQVNVTNKNDLIDLFQDILFYQKCEAKLLNLMSDSINFRFNYINQRHIHLMNYLAEVKE